MQNLDIAEEINLFTIEEWELKLRPILRGYYTDKTTRKSVFKEVVAMLHSQFLLFPPRPVLKAFEAAFQNIGTLNNEIIFPCGIAIADAIRSSKTEFPKKSQSHLLHSLTRDFSYRVLADEYRERKMGNRSYPI